MIDFKTMCKTFRERADTWELENGDLGKIVASEIRGIVDVFEEEICNSKIPSRWIPVTESKPKPDVKVLAWSKEMESHGHAVSFGKRITGRVIDECRFENTSGFYFTHWLPIPDPPNPANRP